MKSIIILQLFAAVLLHCTITANATTVERKSSYRLNRELTTSMQLFVDTLPRPVTSAEPTTAKPVTEKPVATVIKAVPKARKVPVPKPVTIKVKPVKVIKPKIIKPVLKVL